VKQRRLACAAGVWRDDLRRCSHPDILVCMPQHCTENSSLTAQEFGEMFEALRAVAAFYFRADKQGICDTLEHYGVAEML